MLYHVYNDCTEGVTVTVTPDKDSTITIIKDAGAPSCDACVDDGQNTMCNLTKFVLSKPVEASIQFNCTQPQDAYTVKTEGKIGEL